ncbi:hypothetical protein SKAU_G00410680 [Synaphobranchus kaupii]|uniref:Uncharacterized protein n=1 Tax=Synaphobranchus kaupii TaxID=118154 RepID=A0A9Q1IBN7_SYNKA|nr:hypothetical protein SKAU_G00410680 [Synaphobranchus kaupii]
MDGSGTWTARELGRLGNLEGRDGLDGPDGQEPDRSGARREGSTWALTRLTVDSWGKERPGQSQAEAELEPDQSVAQDRIIIHKNIGSLDLTKMSVITVTDFLRDRGVSEEALTLMEEQKRKLVLGREFLEMS